LDVGEGFEVERGAVIGVHRRVVGGLELPLGDGVDFHEVPFLEEEEGEWGCGVVFYFWRYGEVVEMGRW
jgi:hypothetical protein